MSNVDAEIEPIGEIYNRDRRLMLFELSVGGHYAGYIQHLIQYWRDRQLLGRLDIVVSPKFMVQHQDVVEIARSCERESVNFVIITAAEAAALVPRKSPVHRAVLAFQMWYLLCKYGTALGATHCLIMYLDSFQSPLAAGAKAPCPISGIYFRPTFHYSTFDRYQPTWKDRIQHWREKLILPRVLNHPQLQTLFCLDPFAIEHLKRYDRVKALHLPDPVQIYDCSVSQLEQLKQTLGIQPNRRVFLLFGAIDGRKGIHQLLEAILMLSPALCQQLCLLIVGPVDARDKLLMQPRISEIEKSLPVQLIIRDRFIGDRQIQPYFQIADVILALYQKHVGMSAILARAATAQKPVLASDYGLMGETARRYQLGLTVNSAVPSEIAQGLTRFLTESAAHLCNRTTMKAFADRNSAEDYARVIFEHVCHSDVNKIQKLRNKPYIKEVSEIEM